MPWFKIHVDTTLGFGSADARPRAAQMVRRGSERRPAEGEAERARQWVVQELGADVVRVLAALGLAPVSVSRNRDFRSHPDGSWQTKVFFTADGKAWALRIYPDGVFEVRSGDVAVARWQGLRGPDRHSGPEAGGR